jgi:hypothetical protein
MAGSAFSSSLPFSTVVACLDARRALTRSVVATQFVKEVLDDM